MRTFSSSVLITVPNVGRLLCQTPTDRNTARRAAKGASQAEKRERKKAPSGQLGATKHPVYNDFLTPDRGT